MISNLVNSKLWYTEDYYAGFGFKEVGYLFGFGNMKMMLKDF